MLEKLFGSPPPLEEIIPRAIRKLKVQHVKLERVVVRLRRRDQVLFEKCTIAVENEKRELAVILANELAELRKLIGIVTQTQIVIERVIIRLETIRELNSIVVDLKPVLNVLQNVSRSLDTAMPEVASELGKVSDTINETLVTTQIGSPQPVIPVDIKTPGGEEILREASTILKENVAARLPEPPRSVTMKEKAEPAKEVRQAVALSASCSEAYEEGNPPDYVYKDMELRRLSLRIERSASVEERVLDYAKRCKGQLDVARCAVELNVSTSDVEKAIENLGTKGKIKVRTVQ